MSRIGFVTALVSGLILLAHNPVAAQKRPTEKMYAQCEAAFRGLDVEAYEKHCSYMKDSPDRINRKLYFGALALKRMAHFKLAEGASSPFLAKAIDAYSTAIALAEQGPKSADDAELYAWRCFAYLQNKPPEQVASPDASKARDDCTIAISLDPKYALAYLYRGYAYNQLLDPNSAWYDFEKAYQLNPSQESIREAYEKQYPYSPQGQEELRNIWAPPTKN